MPNSPVPFDSENVERYEGVQILRCSDSKWEDSIPIVVNAFDYDSLLALYRDTQAGNMELAARIEEIERMFGVPDGVAEKLIPHESLNRPWPEFKKDLRSEGKSS